MRSLCKIFLFFNLSFLFSFAAGAQSADSLLSLGDREKYDTLWVRVATKASRASARKVDTLTAFRLCREAITVAEKLGYKRGLGMAYGNLGGIHDNLGNYQESLRLYDLSRKNFAAAGDSLKVAYIISNMGMTYYALGNWPKSLEHLVAAMQSLQRLKDAHGTFNTLNAIGNVFLKSRDHASALKYYEEAFRIYADSAPELHVNALANMGVVFMERKEYDKAKEYILRCLPIRKKTGNTYLLAGNYLNIGVCFFHLQRFDSSVHYIEMSKKLRLENGDRRGYATSCFRLAQALNGMKDHSKALKNLFEGKSAAEETGALDELREGLQVLAYTYAQLKKFDSAYHYSEQYIDLHDRLLNDAMKTELTRTEMNFQFEKKEMELKAEAKRHEEEARVQRIVSWVSIIGGSVIFFLLVFAVRAYRAKERSNRLIVEQKKEIEFQKDEIEEKQKEILDSIRYARRIQQSMLPNDRYFGKHIH